MRIEKDYIGQKEIPNDAFFGIHALRAKENFPDQTPFHLEWYQAIGLVKLACYKTYDGFIKAIKEKYKTVPFKFIDQKKSDALKDAALEVSKGKHFEHFIVPAICGGAGTSINMNVNEIIANVALVKSGFIPGDYKEIDPIEDANIYQSTNDVIPTSLKLAAMKLLTELESKINDLKFVVETYEKNHRNDLRIAYTQMQEAVPSSFGRLFSTYNEALGRDWWRVSKCNERIKVVNLGGSAIGTGISVPKYFILEVVQNLKQLTNLSITRSENMSDATSNLDSLVEVHAILKAHAVNLEKMVGDIRLLASDLHQNELVLPQIQVGSSIMPGKINPVIPEYIISAAHKIYANDQLISNLAAQGCLELNAYLPTIGHALLESLKLLIGMNTTLKNNLFNGLIVNTELSFKKLMFSPAITTALLPYIGYNKASELAKQMKLKGQSILEANAELGFLDTKKLETILEPQNLLKEGFNVNDIL